MDAFTVINEQIKVLSEKMSNEQDITKKMEIINNLNDLLAKFSELNLNNRNKATVETFAEKIVNKKNKHLEKYVKLINSTSVYGIITAPTQVGKTKSSIDLIETCIKYKVPIIISSDNKTDQQTQLFNRIKADLVGTDSINIELLKIKDASFASSFKKCIINGKIPVIFCLDNASQIEKIIVNFNDCITRKIKNIETIKKLMIIHDEGDVIQKDHDIKFVNNEQAKSHQKWIELSDTVNTFIDLKRVFVTATPDNVLALYKIESANIIKLEIPNNYQGHKNINYNIVDNDFDIKEILINETRRIVNNLQTNPVGEVILYCIERERNNHDDVIIELKKILPDSTINSYNSNGIIVYTKNKKLINIMKEVRFPYTTKTGKIRTKISKSRKNAYDNYILDSKMITITHFYDMCKEAGEKVVITIGKDLINRGISYVSSCKENPLCATTMIYRPGQTMHAVGDNQTIGRITGYARPDLKRILYAPKKVIDTYKNYNLNQEMFLKELITGEVNQITTDVWNNYEFEHKLYKPLERKKLNIKIKIKKQDDENVDTSGVSETIDGVNLKKLKKWVNDDTLIGKMIRFLYDQEKEINIEEFKNGLEYEGNDEQFKNNIDNGDSNASKYGKLWITKSNKITINENIKKYIELL